MSEIRNLLICLFITLSSNLMGQLNRGNLLTNQVPYCIQHFFTDDKVNLEALRSTTDFLTNSNITTFEDQLIPGRKKAFVRHVKHLSEFVEQQYRDDIVQHPYLVEVIYELYLLEASLKQKTQQNAQVKIPFREKVALAFTTITSKHRLTYKIPSKAELNLENTLTDPVNSPYYHHIAVGLPLHEQFAYLAKLKKIKQTENMVVLYRPSELSGSAPKISALDLDLDNKWNIKWGDEVHTDILASRVFASLGYDVDHAYYYGKDELTLVFDEETNVNNAEKLIDTLKSFYKIDITSFISNRGVITKEMASENKELKPFIGKKYVQFVKCAVEARPDRVKRIGSFLPNDSINAQRKELKGALLAHHFIGNWDTKEDNTLLTTVHDGNYNYRISAVFSDLGTSLGVTNNWLPPDFKVGLVNNLPWEVIKLKRNKISFTNRINSILPAYKNAEYQDLYWMATKIATIDEHNLRKMIKKAHWPEPISELYFHKLASRRASILKAFGISDPHPILFNKKVNITHLGVLVVKNGKLVKDFQRELNPESFIDKKGRLRDYGH